MQEWLVIIHITDIMTISINLAQLSCLGSSLSFLALSYLELKFLHGLSPYLI